MVLLGDYFVLAKSGMPKSKTVIIAITMLGIIWLASSVGGEHFIQKNRWLMDAERSTAAAEMGESDGRIKDKVALITDTYFTDSHIPLILHFSHVLGPSWPIVYLTTKKVIDDHLHPQLKNGSAAWTRAVNEGRIELRIIPEDLPFKLDDRNGVNKYLSNAWIWDQLAPAKHVLLFQADAILCANAHKTVDDFLEYDMVGAPLVPSGWIYNGGLSLRNRTMMLDIIKNHNWEKEAVPGDGEDVWFSRHIKRRGGHIPNNAVASEFACEHGWTIEVQKHPVGYHKVHKWAPNKIKEISVWCPEIGLARPGPLK
ncbi:hypothetical protein H072_9826 [Dactylellina haptotyla CBS 200.50]|uniref:DUF5672 domain-containing protein n=1 Tax=Dactylellina haptotyla (strain CBS 200.50) TaxID=1284197 RepID=S8BMV8_DACHA|nr:hypothetical protein H072_9826 [Dactylellina haptotyla CBS 200.50]